MVHVDENRHILMSGFGTRLIKTNPSDKGTIQSFEGLSHIVENNPPQPFVVLPNDPGGRPNRHLSAKGKRCLLKQKSEGASLPGPGYFDQLDSVLRALDPGNHGVDVAMVLKKVEVPPNLFTEVMGGTQFFAFRTGILGPSFGFDFEVELVGNMIGVQLLGNEFPGGLEPETKNHDFTCIHAISS